MPYAERTTKRTALMTMTTVGVALALAVPAARGQSPYLVRDLAPGYRPANPNLHDYTAPYDLVQTGGRTFFFGNLGDRTTRSWRCG
jgi:hypothetical protein